MVRTAGQSRRATLPLGRPKCRDLYQSTRRASRAAVNVFSFRWGRFISIRVAVLLTAGPFRTVTLIFHPHNTRLPSSPCHTRVFSRHADTPGSPAHLDGVNTRALAVNISRLWHSRARALDFCPRTRPNGKPRCPRSKDPQKHHPDRVERRGTRAIRAVPDVAPKHLRGRMKNWPAPWCLFFVTMCVFIRG